MMLRPAERPSAGLPNQSPSSWAGSPIAAGDGVDLSGVPNLAPASPERRPAWQTAQVPSAFAQAMLATIVATPCTARFMSTRWASHYSRRSRWRCSASCAPGWTRRAVRARREFRGARLCRGLAPGWCWSGRSSPFPLYGTVACSSGADPGGPIRPALCGIAGLSLAFAVWVYGCTRGSEPSSVGSARVRRA